MRPHPDFSQELRSTTFATTIAEPPPLIAKAMVLQRWILQRWNLRLCYKGCISGCVVKSSLCGEATLATTSGLLPRATFNDVRYNNRRTPPLISKAVVLHVIHYRSAVSAAAAAMAMAAGAAMTAARRGQWRWRLRGKGGGATMTVASGGERRRASACSGGGSSVRRAA